MSVNSKAINGNSFHILLIEDDEVDIQSVKRELAKLEVSFDLAIAKNGMEALDKLYGKGGQEKLEPKPNLILLDINMPKMNGIDFLKKIRADENLKHITVFILTTAYTSRDKMATQGLNVTGYIVKPLQFDDVMSLYWSIIGTGP